MSANLTCGFSSSYTPSRGAIDDASDSKLNLLSPMRRRAARRAQRLARTAIDRRAPPCASKPVKRNHASVADFRRKHASVRPCVKAPLCPDKVKRITFESGRSQAPPRTSKSGPRPPRRHTPSAASLHERSHSRTHETRHPKVVIALRGSRALRGVPHNWPPGENAFDMDAARTATHFAQPKQHARRSE